MGKQFSGVSYNEMDNALEYTHQIIQSLPDIALNQLLQGYGGDIDRVFDSLVSETNRVINLDNYSPVSLTQIRSKIIRDKS